MTTPRKLGPKGARLLAVLVSQIRLGRVKPQAPATFLSYSETVALLGLPPKGRAGQQLQREGLDELDRWTRENPALPKIAGLIVDQKRHLPGAGFAKGHGQVGDDWEAWWLAETARAITFDWSPYLAPRYPEASGTASVVREGDERLDYRRIITIEPGKRGGKPCIRRMRITVGDVLGWLAAGMSHAEIFADFPELTPDDIRACLAFAAEKENHAVSLSA